MLFKICGLKNKESLFCCEENNADFFGMIFYEKSPRHITINEAKTLIIISKEISSFKSIKFGAFEEDFMMYTNKKGEVYPSRSFGGKNWYGGYSDHLPVFLKMSYLIK